MALSSRTLIGSEFSLEDGTASILIIRGPPGAGKTSVSLVLRDKLAPAARISVDVLRYMVTPRNFSPKLLRTIKLSTGQIATSFAREGISSIIESTFTSEEVLAELCDTISMHGYAPHVFTLVADKATVMRQNLERELYYQTDQHRVDAIYSNYNWDVGQKIFIEGKEIEEVAADILMHLEKKKQEKIFLAKNQKQEKEGDNRYILFLRHGQALNDPNIFLSDYEKSLSLLGEDQGKNIAATINLFNPQAIFCSPFLRTKMTAQIACANVDRKIIFKEGLIEHAFPMFYSKTREEIKRAYSVEILKELEAGRSSELEIPGNETVLEGQQRVVCEIKKILKQPFKRILIISHGGPHSWLCCHYLGVDLSQARIFSLNEAHVTLFQFNQEGDFKKIITMNTTQLPHLAPPKTNSSLTLIGKKE